MAETVTHRPAAPDLCLRHLPHPMLVCEPHGAIRQANPAARTLSNTLDLPGVEALLPGHHRRLVADLATNPAPLTVEATVRGRVLSWTYTGMPDPERPVPAAVLLTAMDITARRRTEAQLRLSEARHRLLAEESTDLISRHTPEDWRFLYASPAARRLLGYDPEDLIGRSSHELIHPADVDTYRRRAPSVFYHRGIYTNTYRFRCRDGRYIWLETTSRVLRDPVTQQPLEIICVSRDVSRRVEAEQHKQHYQQELAHTARLITLGEMASSLAHELNQPLAAIVNYARGCIHRLDADTDGSSAMVRDGLTRIASQAQRAAQIIKRLRGFVRKGEYQRIPTPIDTVLTDMIGLIEPDARRHHIGLDFQPGRDLPPAPMDKVQIEQVVLNLLRNALEACQQTQSRCTVTVRSQYDQGHIQVLVMDQGKGLPAQRERLFEQFFTTKPRGLGMGLAISRSIIEAHQGRLWAEDNPGGGACFGFSLPAAAPARPPSHNKSQEPL